MDKLLIPLAYKYVALTLMLAEINDISQRLNLPVERPLVPQNFHVIHVAKPFLTGFGGTLETDKFSFVFFKSGILRRITRLNAFENLPLRELQWKQSRMTSLVNSNQAYQLATNWLGAVSVDVAALEKRYRPSVEQTFFYPDSIDLEDPP